MKENIIITLRIIVVIIFFGPWYVFGIMACSIFGIILIVAILRVFCYPIILLTSNSTYSKDEYLETTLWAFSPIWLPLKSMYDFITKGELLKFGEE